MPSNENEYDGRVTRSRSRGAPVTESAASVAPTKPPAAKPQRKAATNASSTTKGRGGGKKSSSTARSTPAAEDANVVADAGSLIFTPDDFISLSKDDQKRKIQAIFTDLGIQDITEGIPSSKANNLRACLPLSQADFQKFLKQWVPGYTEKSNDILTLADHLRKAVFPAPSLALIPAGKKDANTKDDVSLRAAYLHICGVPSQSSNGWDQNILMKGIQKQLDSEIDGGDYHYTKLTDNELIDKLQRCDGKKITIKKRLKLVKESWKRDHPGSDFDYTTSTANASHGRSVPVAPTTPAPAAANEDELAQLQLEVARLKVEDQKNQNNHNQRMNGYDINLREHDITLREQQFRLGEQQGQINELTVQQMRERDKNEKQFMVVHERLNHTATKKDLQSFKEDMEEKIKEEMRRREDDGMKEDGGENDVLVGAALDFSDSSSDEESASSPCRAGVPAVTPMDKKTVKVSKAAPVHADNYRVFLRRLKDAMRHGQGGREVEMNACLKEAEHIMLNTKLNEEWNTWHDNFNKKSECARKLFSQYGLKPAAR